MTNTDKVLALLRGARAFGNGWVSIHQFLAADAGTRYGARIDDLRKQGFQIEQRYFGLTGRGDHRYRLVREPRKIEPGQDKNNGGTAPLFET